MPDNKKFRENAYGDFNNGDYVRGEGQPHPPQPYDVDEDRIEDGLVGEPAPPKGSDDE